MKAKIALRLAAASLYALVVVSHYAAESDAQTTGRTPRSRPRVHLNPGDGPNASNETDLAAGRFVDSLFNDDAPHELVPRSSSMSVRSQPPEAYDAGSAAKWSGRLVRNPRTDDGRPPYVIIDRYGGVKRYVEPSAKVDLERYVGRFVGVRRDTGDTLLASQLALPRLSGGAADSVRLAAHAEEVEGEPLTPIPSNDEPMVFEEGSMAGEGLYFEEEPGGYIDEGYGGYYDGGMTLGGCPSCGSSVCGSSPCGFGSRPILYFRAQYLVWWVDGMNTPPLIIEDAVDDTFQNAVVTYGGDKVLQDVRNGGRASLGYWLDDYGKWAVEGDYLGLEKIGETAVAGAKDGLIPNVAVGRPFINVYDFDANGDGDVLDPGDVPRGRAVEEVDTTGLDGSVTVDVDSKFQSAGLRLRRGLCCSSGCGVNCGSGVGCGDAVGCSSTLGPMMGVRRIDAVVGVRWAQLDEGLRVTEDLATRDTVPTTFLLRDQFLTSNEFVGGDVGFIWEWEHRRLSLELLSRIALGSTRQQVQIAGSTLRDAGQATQALATGGLLALPSNIGVYTRDQFSVMPELGATFGYALTDRLRLSVGYTFLYWSNVVRPGDQIDNVIDISQVPIFDGATDPDNPAVQPGFNWRETGLWAHGVNLGVDYRW
ncbi:MAG: BBP7 family outer membrane beta-barrel protein [Planctomycetales bacterium]|nr:BBP7 family outer membrane beta-barrel protein [Planctomycetales bacterium]